MSRTMGCLVLLGLTAALEDADVERAVLHEDAPPSHVEKQAHYEQVVYNQDLLQTLGVLMMSVLADIFVVCYHFSHPPHPKFRMRRLRIFSIYTHLLSGVSEIALGIVAFVLPYPAPYATAMASVGIAGHVTSSAYQTPIVFGAKRVMVPAYAFCIGMHLYCCIRLLLDPISVRWLLHTFGVLHVYVWCRVSYLIMWKFRIFEGSLYTASIITAGLIMLPVLGVGINLACVIFICVWNLLLECSGMDLSWWTEEYNMATVDTTKEVQHMIRYVSTIHQLDCVMADKEDSEREADNRARAHAFFNHMDADKDGVITEKELLRMLVKTKVSFAPEKLKKLIAVIDLDNNGIIDFDEFYKHLWNPHSTNQRILNQELENVTSGREKASIVFQLIDIDKSGSINSKEVQSLLRVWGMPPGEAKLILRKFESSKSRYTREKKKIQDKQSHNQVAPTSAAKPENDMTVTEKKRRTSSDLKGAFATAANKVLKVDDDVNINEEAFFVYFRPLWKFAFARLRGSREKQLQHRAYISRSLPKEEEAMIDEDEEVDDEDEDEANKIVKDLEVDIENMAPPKEEQFMSIDVDSSRKVLRMQRAIGILKKRSRDDPSNVEKRKNVDMAKIRLKDYCSKLRKGYTQAGVIVDGVVEFRFKKLNGSMASDDNTQEEEMNLVGVLDPVGEDDDSAEAPLKSMAALSQPPTLGNEYDLFERELENELEML